MTTYNVFMDGTQIRTGIDIERLGRFLKKIEFEGGREKKENQWISQFGSVIKIEKNN